MESACVKITECPRDAMQGLPGFIPTKKKAAYINSLLKVGFDVIDFGSFVSPKAIPQMRDTAELVSLLELDDTSSKLLSIIGNMRGAEHACSFSGITYLGFPHSVSPTFLKRNINSTIEKSRNLIEELLLLCDKHGKELVVYVSMGFGNPYNDLWDVSVVEEEVAWLSEKGVRIIQLSDTIGVSTPEKISAIFKLLTHNFPELEFGFHLHTDIYRWHQQLDAAFKNGCRSFDTVLLGLGGCPMAEDELVGNLKTVSLIEYLEEAGFKPCINKDAFEKAFIQSLLTFEDYITLI